MRNKNEISNQTGAPLSVVLYYEFNEYNFIITLQLKRIKAGGFYFKGGYLYDILLKIIFR